MADLQAAVEDYLAALPDGEWRALCLRVRPPDEPREVNRLKVEAPNGT
jgi:hypothetical protein